MWTIFGPDLNREGEKKKKQTFNEDAIVESGGFLFVLTAEKTTVINDLGPQ